jgi:hypothetical protein
MIKNKYQSK